MIIKSVFRIDAETVQVKIAMPAKEWSKAKLKGQLGQLYGIDISNKVYHDTGVKAYYPTVDDARRASDGVKSITLIYRDKEWTAPPNNVVRVDFVNRRKAA